MKRGINDKDLVFSNFSYDRKKAYLIFIGSWFKYCKICDFFIKPLREHYGRKVDVINIFNNFPPSYFNGKYIVINGHLKKLMAKSKGHRFYFVTSSQVLNKEVSECKLVRNLIIRILKNQKDLFLYLFKDTPEMTLQSEFNNVNLIGPKTKLFSVISNKFFQHSLADTLHIPQPKWFLASDKKDLLKIYSKRFSDGRVFVSKLHSYSGKGCAIVKSKKELQTHPHINRKKCKYIISKLINVLDSPTCEAIVANDHEVFSLGLTDQIMKGPSYVGSISPSKLKNTIQRKIEKYTVQIGKYLGGIGYVGFFGVDWVVDSKGGIYFSEINPRMSSSTLERVYMYEITKQRGAPSLPELEFMAVTKGTFGNLKFNRIRDKKFSWGLFHIEVEKGSTTVGNILPKYSEFEVFKKFGTTILDFPGKNVCFGNDSRLCRIVSVKSSRKEVEEELIKHANLALKYVRKN